MLKWCAVSDENDPALSSIKGYDLPFGMEFIKGSRLWKYFPFSPTFQGFPWEKQPELRERGIQFSLIYLPKEKKKICREKCNCGSDR